MSVLSMLRRKFRDSFRQRMFRKAINALNGKRGLRRNEVDDIFERVVFIFPSDLKVRNFPGKNPVAVFNPGAVLKDDVLYVFPRLIFDYYNYTSSIGRFELDIERVMSGLKGTVETDVILWPRNVWEFKGCEDARAYLEGERLFLLYTGYGYAGKLEREYLLKPTTVQGIAVFDKEGKEVERGFLKVSHKGETLPLLNVKDSAIITSKNRTFLLTRPTVEHISLCWKGVVELKEFVVEGESLEPVFVNESWELKVGWSTNAVRVSSNEFLVGWHGVVKEDLSYRNGLALVDEQGDLLAISNYLLSPRGLVEEYGDRPHVIFGDGLVLHDDTLIWVGGVSDYATGVFTTPLQKALDKLKWVRG